MPFRACCHRQCARSVACDAGCATSASPSSLCCARGIEKQVGYLEEVRKWAETVKGHGEKIVDRSARMVDELRRDVERLDAQIAQMRTAEATV